MEFRLASKSDLEGIMSVIEDARKRLKESGSLQWNTPEGYPDSSDILIDINNNHGYIVIDSNKIVGYVALIIGFDDSYKVIDGKWLSDDIYLTIHRIAVSTAMAHKGVGQFIIDEASIIAKKNNLKSIKADTHKININMIGLLRKKGFKRCGEIELLHTKIDNKREAFELLL